MLLPNGMIGSIERQSITSEGQRDVSNWNDLTIKGTCKIIEKSYFRLTSAPDPADVRPEEILKVALKMMSKKWKNGEADYRYIDEQFRSMR